MASDSSRTQSRHATPGGRQKALGGAFGGLLLVASMAAGTGGCAHGTSPADLDADETRPSAKAAPPSESARQYPNDEGSANDEEPAGPILAYPAGAVATFAPNQTDPTHTTIRIYGPRPTTQSKPIAKLESPSTPGSIASLAFDAKRQLYTVDYSGRINVFASGASGSDAPIRTINPEGLYTNADHSYAEAVAIDSVGRIYMSLDTYPGYAGPNSIVVYPPNASGAATAIREIVGPDTGLRAPIALGFDRDDHLFVGDYLAMAVFVYAADADGDQRPVRTACVSEGLQAMAVAPDGKLYVAPEGVPGWSVHIYDPWNGTSQEPAGAIQGPDTGLDTPDEYPIALAIDPGGGVTLIGPQKGLRYETGAEGNVAPAGSFGGWNALAVAPRG